MKIEKAFIYIPPKHGTTRDCVRCMREEFKRFEKITYPLYFIFRK